MAVALVTGGGGFIGRELVHRLYLEGHYIVVVDADTYAARLDLLTPYQDRCKIVVQDVRDLRHWHGASVVFHLAAESHVDNSISDPATFFETNVMGTFALLERLRGTRAHDRPALVHVSTDEVYGDLDPDDPPSREEDHLRPSSPYAASKASADLLVQAWRRTYGLVAQIVRPSNCYGPHQYHEKLVPKIIRSWLLDRPMPIHGDGSQTRSWLAVEDCARALVAVWQRGAPDGIYNIPGNAEVSVQSVVRRVLDVCAEVSGAPITTPPTTGHERPGGDRRYRVDGARLGALGWEARGELWTDLHRIVQIELNDGIVL